MQNNVKQLTNQWFGFLPINKPTGMTSRRAVDVVKRLVKPNKVGHTGTLDPLAEGLLVVCIGPATRLASFVQQSMKSYEGSFRLGVTSKTDDIEGELEYLERPPEISREALESLLPSFVGRIRQVPPAFSAIKIKGKRAYQLARSGKQVELNDRDVQIYDVQLIHFDYPEFRLRIKCGAGTYIRSIGRDIGRRLNSAAVMTHLTRTSVGNFDLGNSVAIDDLNIDSIRKHLLSPSSFFKKLPTVEINPAQVRRLVHGGVFSADQLSIEPGLRRVVALDSNRNFLALLQSSDDGNEYRIEINFANQFVNIE